MLQSQKITVTTTGVAGSAAGTGYSSRPISGAIKAVRVDWSASAPVTSDITITVDSDDDHPAVTIYTKSDSATDAWAYPSVQATGTDGAAITGVYQDIVGVGRVKVVVAQCDALAAAVVVYVWFDDLGR